MDGSGACCFSSAGVMRSGVEESEDDSEVSWVAEGRALRTDVPRQVAEEFSAAISIAV